MGKAAEEISERVSSHACLVKHVLHDSGFARVSV